MPLFSKGVSTSDFAGQLRAVTVTSVHVFSVAQYLAKPASFFPAGGDRDFSTAIMIEKTLDNAASDEQHLVGRTEQLRTAKPGDKKLQSLHENASAFFTELAKSLVQHNQGTILHLRGDPKKAKGHFKDGMKHERAAVKAMGKFSGDLYTAHGGTVPTYAQLGFDRDLMDRFEDRYSPFTLIDGKISMWDDFDLEPNEAFNT